MYLTESILKATLFVNMSMNPSFRKETEKELKKLSGLCKSFDKKDFSCYGTFAYDVLEGEKLTNKEIALELNKLGFIDDQGQPKIPSLKFL